MKFIIVLAGLLLPALSVTVSSNFFNDYLKDRYTVKIVSDMPQGIKSQIIVISSRNFRADVEFGIKRGLDPRYRLSNFIAGLRNDTAYIIPVDRFEKIKDYLSPEKDILVLVDGHGKTFGHSMERGFELTERFTINMIVFDWPTDYLALRKTVYNSADASVSFVKAMKKLDALKKEDFPNSAVSVIFHSMGNRILKEIACSPLLQKMPGHLFSNLIINAAAVKQHNHKKWVEKLDIQKRIYITMNEKDFNLRGAAMLRMSKQLGMTNKNRSAKNAYYVNFSQLSTIEHNLFLGRSSLEKTNPELQQFYDHAFHGREVILDKQAGIQILIPSDKSFLFSVR